MPAQTIVDGLRTGNAWSSQGQLIDRLAFVACASYAGIGARTNAAVEAIAFNAALGNTDTDVAGCATMGEKLKLNAGGEIVVSAVVRDPALNDALVRRGVRRYKERFSNERTGRELAALLSA